MVTIRQLYLLATRGHGGRVEHSRLPPLRPGFDSWHGLKWESW